jgi:hypothetical protein
VSVELWDDKYGNAIEEFENEDDALAFVRKMIEQRGEKAIADWALDPMDDRPMVRGRELLRRAKLAHA